MPEERKTPDPLEQYELGDSSFDPALDSHSITTEDVPPEPAAKLPQPPAPSDRQRNPDGTFAKPEPVTAAPKHRASLVSMAEDFGLTQAEIDESTSEHLQDRLHDIQRLLRTRKQEEPVTPSTTPEPKPLLDPAAGYDPELTDAVNTMHKRVAALEAHLAGMAQAHQAQTHGEQMDAGFGDLGADYEAFFGKGRIHELEKGGPEQMRRRMVNNMLLEDKGPDSVRSKAARLGKLLFPATAKSPPATPDKPSLTDEQRRWNEAALAKPTQRNGAPEPKGERLAAKMVAKQLQAMHAYDGDEEASIPD